MAHSWRGTPRTNITTATVIEEITRYALPVAGLDWLDVVDLDDLDELTALVRWTELVSGHIANRGEATVLAWAEVHGALPVIDDKDARRVGRTAGLKICGSLRVVAESVVDGRTTDYAATAFVDALIDTGMRYPCARGGFISWAKQNGII
ncbi:hypothetical protein N566_14430 [Streptomycetaceae bacterium MP113-05]|nr:hypothetical protein N566_14430 [Streptomycetaceae bacterium MP113-05]